MTEAPVRPYDVRLVPAAGAAWGSTIAGILCGSSVAGAATLVWICVAAVTVILRSRLGGRWTGLVAAAVIGCCFSGAVTLYAWSAETSPVASAAHDGAWVSAAAVVREDPRLLTFPGPPTVSLRAELRQIDIAGVPVELGGRISVLAPAEGWDAVVPGQRVVVRGKLSPPDRANLTLGILRTHGPPLRVEQPGALANSASAVRSSLAVAAADALPLDRAGLLTALVVGDVSALPEDIENALRAAGLAHLTAVSGANFAIVLGAVLLLARSVGVGPRTTAVVCTVVLLAFVVVARPSPSVLRAAVMGGVGVLALVTGRRRQAVPALCTAVVGLLARWPELAVDYGFALSVAATVGLVLVAPVWVDWLRRHGWGRASAEIVAVAAAAHAVTAPIVAAMAGTFSVVGVLANIAVAPVVAPITVVGAAAAVLAPWATLPASLVLHLASAPLWWLVAVARWAESLPAAGLSTPSGPAGALVVVAATGAVLIVLRVGALRWAIGGAVAAGLLVWVAASMT